MLTVAKDMPRGLAGLEVGGTVTEADVAPALAGLARGARLVVMVAPDFDGYMVELVRGLSAAIAQGTLARVALVVPDAMIPEARLHGRNDRLRVFGASEREVAERWAEA